MFCFWDHISWYTAKRCLCYNVIYIHPQVSNLNTINHSDTSLAFNCIRVISKAWGLEPESRLGCQARVTDEDLVVEIPRYTINHAREH